MAYTDDFAGTGALSGSWTVLRGAADRLTGFFETSAADDWVYYSGGTFANDQYSQATAELYSSGPDSYELGVAVRMNTSLTSPYCYYLKSRGALSSTVVEVGYVNYSNGFNVLASYTQLVSVGDVLRLEVVGDTLTSKYKASGGSFVTLGTVAGGSRRASGYAGLAAEANSFMRALDWEGGDLAVASAALTGTLAAGVTEADIVAGGKVLTITLTGDSFIPA